MLGFSVTFPKRILLHYNLCFSKVPDKQEWAKYFGELVLSLALSNISRLAIQWNGSFLFGEGTCLSSSWLIHFNSNSLPTTQNIIALRPRNTRSNCAKMTRSNFQKRGSWAGLTSEKGRLFSLFSFLFPPNVCRSACHVRWYNLCPE